MNAEEYIVEYKGKIYKDLLDIVITSYDYSYGKRKIAYISVMLIDNGIVKALNDDPEEFKFIRKNDFYEKY